MKNSSMFPFRRGGGKKRGKGGVGSHHHGAPGQGPRHHHHPREGGHGRRVPGSAGELLSMLQPATKALAQMLAGNAKASGQLIHARNVLSQAQRLVEERAVERMPPAQREEFLEQLARLKLTLADADESGLFRDAGEAEPEARPAIALTTDQLRDVARRLATSETPAAAVPSYPPPFVGPDEEAGNDVSADGNGDEGEPGSARPAPEPAAPDAARRGERLRLRMGGDQDPSAAAPVRVRDRLRLKPLKPAAGSSRD
jgi:hypothetical protein